MESIRNLTFKAENNLQPGFLSAVFGKKCFTRDDDLPDGLPQEIDQHLANI